MSRYHSPRILPGLQGPESDMVELWHNGESHYVRIGTILYLKADRDYTRIFLTEPPAHCKTTELYVPRNLGSYHWLVSYRFCRANRGIMFNVNKLACTTPAFKVKLHVPHTDDIIISRTFRKDFLSHFSSPAPAH